MTPKADIRLLRSRYLRGPNIWTYRPVLETWLDLGELEDHPSNVLPGFNDRLTTWLPALMEHHCGVGERGGFIQRLETGTWCGHVLEHVVIELLNLARMPTGFGQTRSTSQRGVYRMVFRARDERVARCALEEGHRLVMSAINDVPFDVAAAVERISAVVDDAYLGPSTAAIVAAATERRIPHIRLNDGNLVQLGYGVRQRRIWTAESDLTSAIAESIAGDKDLTKSLLKSCGVPVPEGQIVHSAQEAWEAAEDIGLPVVVKPLDGNHGTGVSLNLSVRSDIEAAFAVAEVQSSSVLVERYIPGNEHRLLVVGGRVVAAARGELVWVVGDGTHSVEALIDLQVNADPRRGVEEDFPLSRIELDKEPTIVLELQRQGLSPQDVPQAGRKVLIQRNGNVSIDCTDDVHPDVAYLAGLAARIVGLDIAGIDIVAQDIGQPLAAQGGAVVEVNAGPGLLMHLKPGQGAPRPVGQAIVDHLFPPGHDEGMAGRIPVVGITGSVGSNTVARLVAWLLHLGGRKVGLACRDGLFLDRRRVEARNGAHFEPARRLLMNQSVQAVVIENGALSILDDGLAYDRCDLGIVTDLEGAQHLAAHDITDADQLVRVVRTQVDVVLPEGVAVLNAADARVAALAALCDGEAVLYGESPTLPALRTHVEAGGRAVTARNGSVVLVTGASEQVLGPLQRMLPAPTDAGDGESATALSTLLAAVAAAWAMNVSPDLIGAGVEAFDWCVASAQGVSLPPAR